MYDRLLRFPPSFLHDVEDWLPFHKVMSSASVAKAVQGKAYIAELQVGKRTVELSVKVGVRGV